MPENKAAFSNFLCVINCEIHILLAHCLKTEILNNVRIKCLKTCLLTGTCIKTKQKQKIKFGEEIVTS